MAWIGGTVGAGAAVAASAQKKGSGKHRWVYILSVVIAVITFLVVFSQA